MKPFKAMTINNTALVIIDVINSCAHEKYELPKVHIKFTKIRKMIPKLEKFIERYRKVFEGPIFFVKTAPWRKEYLTDNINELYERRHYSYYTNDISGFAEEFHKIKPQKKDIIIEKNTLDVFAIDKIINQLNNKKIKYIIITGIFTDGCVLASIAGGFSRGYSIVVPKDLVETTDHPKRQLLQKIFIDYTFPFLFARVCTSTKLLENFAESSMTK